jgi:hypothetical protein
MVETYRAKYSQVTRNCMGYKSSWKNTLNQR